MGRPFHRAATLQWPLRGQCSVGPGCHSLPHGENVRAVWGRPFRRAASMQWPLRGQCSVGPGCHSLPRGENVRAVWGRPCALTRSPGPGRTGHPAAWPSPGFGVALVAACYATSAEAMAQLPRRKHGHREKQSRRISAAGGKPRRLQKPVFCTIRLRAN